MEFENIIKDYGNFEIKFKEKEQSYNFACVAKNICEKSEKFFLNFPKEKKCYLYIEAIRFYTKGKMNQKEYLDNFVTFFNNNQNNFYIKIKKIDDIFIKFEVMF